MVYMVAIESFVHQITAKDDTDGCRQRQSVLDALKITLSQRLLVRSGGQGMYASC